MIRDAHTSYRITNHRASQVFLFTVDPQSGNEVAAGTMLPNTISLGSNDQGALKPRPSTVWRVKDAAGAVLKIYVTGDANHQTIDIKPTASRRNQRNLTAAEKQRFTKAVLALKAEKQPHNTLSTYDVFVKWHDDAMVADVAHRGPAFLAWHREYLRRFELELLRISFSDPSIGGAVLGLPYWDWSVDQAAPSWPFTADFLGGNGTADPGFPLGKVMDGPFAGEDKWRLTVFAHDEPPSEHYPYLRRQFGADPHPEVRTLPSENEVRTTLEATPFDSAPWDRTSQSGFRNRLEGRIPQARPDPPDDEYIPKMHNRIHAYIGGTMGPSTSPNDPVFWLHHCYVDKLWADWQRRHPNYTYLPDGGARAGHNLRDVMAPWNEKAPKDVLDIRQLEYEYDTG